jgi:hypothetical protein
LDIILAKCGKRYLRCRPAAESKGKITALSLQNKNLITPAELSSQTYQPPQKLIRRRY